MGYTPTGQWGDLHPPVYIEVNDVTVHDTTGFTQCGSHTDGWQSFGCQHCTLEKAGSFNNDTSDVIIYQIIGAATEIQNILIQNNSIRKRQEPRPRRIDRGEACSSDQSNNVIVQNNTFYTALTGDIGCGGGCAHGGHVAE